MKLMLLQWFGVAETKFSSQMPAVESEVPAARSGCLRGYQGAESSAPAFKSEQIMELKGRVCT
jgi:hypothetical protein